MPRKPPEIELTRAELLSESEHRSTSMALPLALHQRLDVIAEQARGLKASRAELIAMLIAEVPLDRDEIRRRVNQYRELRVGDVFPRDPEATDQDGEADVIRIKPRRPGRPGHSASG